MMNRWMRRTLEWFVPTQCRLCGSVAGGRVLCPGCEATLGAVTGPGCAGNEGGRVGPIPTHVDRVLWALRFDAVTRDLVHDLKFRGRLPVALLLGERLLDCVRQSGGSEVSLLIPVPLHGLRLFRRGFNQSREIARPLARGLGIPLARPGLCRRVRATAPQSVLGGLAARRRNLAGAFRVTGSLAGIQVAIVDDVLTSGSTVSELARVLRQQGATRVEAWVGCRAGEPGRE